MEQSGVVAVVIALESALSGGERRCRSRDWGFNAEWAAGGERREPRGGGRQLGDKIIVSGSNEHSGEGVDLAGDEVEDDASIREDAEGVIHPMFDPERYKTVNIK
jgi:hypothetical protein